MRTAWWKPWLAMAVVGWWQPIAAAEISVFGIQLGAPLRMPECTREERASGNWYALAQPATCWEAAVKINGYAVPVRRVRFVRSEAPEIVKNDLVMVLEIDGLVAGVHFLTPGPAAQSEVLAQLTAKFGAPSSLVKGTVKNAAGAEFATVMAQWALPHVKVAFDGVAGTLAFGEVTVDQEGAAKLRQQWREQAGSLRRQL